MLLLLQGSSMHGTSPPQRLATCTVVLSNHWELRSFMFALVFRMASHGQQQPTKMERSLSLSLPPGHRGLSKPAGNMPIRLLVGAKRMKNECRSSARSCHETLALSLSLSLPSCHFFFQHRKTGQRWNPPVRVTRVPEVFFFHVARRVNEC